MQHARGACRASHSSSHTGCLPFRHKACGGTPPCVTNIIGLPPTEQYTEVHTSVHTTTYRRQSSQLLHTHALFNVHNNTTLTPHSAAPTCPTITCLSPPQHPIPIRQTTNLAGGRTRRRPSAHATNATSRAAAAAPTAASASSDLRFAPAALAAPATPVTLVAPAFSAPLTNRTVPALLPAFLIVPGLAVSTMSSVAHSTGCHHTLPGRTPKVAMAHRDRDRAEGRGMRQRGYSRC